VSPRYRQGGQIDTALTMGETFIEPAPGLLLQQSGSEVRVVFATYENGCLTPVVDNANYCESYIVPDAVARPPKRTGPPPR
jgi:hypothetical protein